ncbi:elongation factor G [bacterium]|nr:elongation factor G [bacterium]
MKVYPTSRIRNIALAGHTGSGKTTLTEAMLWQLKQSERFGKTGDGNTVSDYDPEEVRRQVSIQASVIPLEYEDCKINLLDLPGYRDFVGEIKGGMRPVETMLLVLDASSGFDTGAEFAWQYADEFNLARVVFINKLDKENASFQKAVDSIQNALGIRLAPIVMPVGEGTGLEAVIDLLKMKLVRVSGQKVTFEDIPANLADEAQAMREQLVEAAAEGDDELTMKFLDEGKLEQEEVMRGLAAVMRQRRAVPVLGGSAAQMIGIRSLLDLAAQCLPDPTISTSYSATVGKSEEAEPVTISGEGSLVLHVFKTIIDPFAGKISLFKVLRGTGKGELALTNVNQNKTERIAHLLVPKGKQTIDIDELHAGDIGCAVKLESVHTGDTLTQDADIKVTPLALPKPNVFMSVHAKSRADEDKIGIGFHRLIEQDPSLKIERNPETVQTILSGNGETHLQVAVNRIKDLSKVDVELESPKIPYRETITRKAEGQGKHKKQTGGHGQYGDCWIRFEPLPEGSGFEFVWEVVGGVVPTNFKSAIEKGLVESLQRGVLSGSPTVDVKAACYFGSYHAVDSSDMAFKVAASLAFKNVIPKCGPIILEPVSKVTINIPEEYMGDVMGDLNSRRGRILGMNPTGKKQVITAHVPLSELTTYSRQLNSITQGRGTFEMEFDHYERVPGEVQEKIIAEAKARQEAEE